MTRYAAKTISSPVPATIGSDNEDIQSAMELDNSNPPVCQPHVDADEQFLSDSGSDIEESDIEKVDSTSESEYESDDLIELLKNSKQR